MADSKKCAHPVCSCTVTSEKYCSVECEAMEKTPDIACKCGMLDARLRRQQQRNVKRTSVFCVKGSSRAEVWNAGGLFCRPWRFFLGQASMQCVVRR